MGAPLARADRDAVARAVRQGERAGEVGACVREILARQMEGRLLFAGAEFVEAAMRRHELERPHGETALGNVFQVLSEGPGTATARGLVVGFALTGLARSLEKQGERVRDELTAFVRGADWLETATDYAVYPLVESVLAPEHQRAFWQAVADSVVTDAGEPLDHGARARLALRLFALHGAEHPSARECLDALAGQVRDGELARVLAGLARPAVDTEADARLEGTVVRMPRGPLRAALRWVTGWALLSWVVRGLLAALGFRKRAEITLVESRLRVVQTTHGFGRVVTVREALVPLYALRRLEEHVRFPFVYGALGVTMLSLGALLGGGLVLEGVRSSETKALLVGAVVLFVGVASDLALDIVGPGRRGVVLLDVLAEPGFRLRLRADQGAVRAFLEAATPKLERRRTPRT